MPISLQDNKREGVRPLSVKEIENTISVIGSKCIEGSVF
jgi:hypothetical protein